MADIQNLPQYQFARDRYESGCEKARESRLPDYMGCANTLPPQKRDSPLRQETILVCGSESIYDHCVLSRVRE